MERTISLFQKRLCVLLMLSPLATIPPIFLSSTNISVGKFSIPRFRGDPVPNSILFVHSSNIARTKVKAITISSNHTYRLEVFQIYICMVTTSLCKSFVTIIYRSVLSISPLNFIISFLRCMVSVISLILRLSILCLEVCTSEAHLIFV